MFFGCLLAAQLPDHLALLAQGRANGQSGMSANRQPADIALINNILQLWLVRQLAGVWRDCSRQFNQNQLAFCAEPVKSGILGQFFGQAGQRAGCIQMDQPLLAQIQHIKRQCGGLQLGLVP